MEGSSAAHRARAHASLQAPVCARVCACACACVRECARARVHLCVGVCAHAPGSMARAMCACVRECVRAPVCLRLRPLDYNIQLADQADHRVEVFVSVIHVVEAERAQVRSDRACSDRACSARLAHSGGPTVWPQWHSVACPFGWHPKVPTLCCISHSALVTHGWLGTGTLATFKIEKVLSVPSQ